MSLSYKKIFSVVNQQKSGFTLAKLQQEILALEKKDKKKAESSLKKNCQRIESALAILNSIGYLEIKDRHFERCADFYLSRKLRLTSKGDGLLREDPFPLKITRQNLAGARNNEIVDLEIIDFQQNTIFAKVINIKKKQSSKILAKLTGHDSKFYFFQPLDLPGVKKITIEKAQTKFLLELGTICVLKEFANSHDEISAVLIKNLGHDLEAIDFNRVCIKHNLPKKYSKDKFFVEKKITATDLKGRKDYRRFFTVTVDGDYSKDFDDAISLEEVRNNYKLYVHIADVSHYVKKDSDLDKKALSRGNSYYLGNQVIPMLPEAISNDICSLREGEDRLTLSVEMTYDKKGNLLNSMIYPGIIRVDKRLTYKNSHQILEEKKPIRLYKKLEKMQKLSQILKKKRIANGKIDLDLEDYELVYNDEGQFTDIIFADKVITHSIIEEFMLSANQAVANFLNKQKIPSLYRIHEPISDEKFESLKHFLKSLGYKLESQADISLTIQEIIRKSKGKKNSEVVNLIVLKSMMQAYYGEKPLGHFGLGFDDYTHFTSPIRRYADLIVHRTVKEYLKFQNTLYSSKELQDIGKEISDLERIAQRAERDLLRIKSCRFLEDYKGKKLRGVISGVNTSGFFVTLKDFPVEGMVPVKKLTDDFYFVYEDDYTVVGKKYAKRYRIGDSITVKIDQLDLDLLRIDFVPVK